MPVQGRLRIVIDGGGVSCGTEDSGAADTGELMDGHVVLDDGRWEEGVGVEGHSASTVVGYLTISPWSSSVRCCGSKGREHRYLNVTTVIVLNREWDYSDGGACDAVVVVEGAELVEAVRLVACGGKIGVI